MKNRMRFTSVVLIASFAIALAGCTTINKPTQQSSLYDLGPLPAATASNTSQSRLPPISVAEIRTPIWLDSQTMYYRLTYANDQQPRAYATTRWAMPPVLLFSQRLKVRLAQAGGIVVSAADGAINIPALHIEVDDFTQMFSNPGQSIGQVAIRASVFNGRTLLAQKSFIGKSPTSTLDAEGGAKALAIASDAVITDMMMWLSELPVKK